MLSSGIVFTGSNLNSNISGSYIKVTNSMIIETNINTVIGSYGNYKSKGVSRIAEFGGISFINTHFILNRFFINKDSNQNSIEDFNRLEPCIVIQHSSCSKDMELKFDHCWFNTVDSTMNQSPTFGIKPTYTSAFYVSSGLSDSSNIISLTNCQIDSFDNCFFAKTNKYKTSGTSINDLSDCFTGSITMDNVGVSTNAYYDTLNQPISINNGTYLLSGNNFDISNCAFTNCNGFIFVQNTNHFNITNSFIDDMPMYLFKIYAPFDSDTKKPLSPFPAIKMIDCSSRLLDSTHNAIILATGSPGVLTNPGLYLTKYIKQCIKSNRSNYSSAIRHKAKYALYGDEFLDYNSSSSMFTPFNVSIIGYDFRQDFDTSTIFHYWDNLVARATFKPNSIRFSETEANITESNQYDICKTNNYYYSILNGALSTGFNNNYTFPVHLLISGSANNHTDFNFIPSWKVYSFASHSNPSTPFTTVASNFDNIDYYSKPNYEFDENIYLAIDDNLPELYSSNATYVGIAINEFDLSRTDCRSNFDVNSITDNDCPTETPMRIYNDVPENLINAFPNPAYNNLNLLINFKDRNENGLLLIYNSNGIIVYKQAISSDAGNSQLININTDNFSSGCYFVKVITQKSNISSKAISIIND